MARRWLLRGLYHHIDGQVRAIGGLSAHFSRRSSTVPSARASNTPLTVGAAGRYHGRTLAVPKSAIFPNQVGGVKFDRFWNFLCRQIFVLTQTHSLEAQRVIAVP